MAANLKVEKKDQKIQHMGVVLRAWRKINRILLYIHNKVLVQHDMVLIRRLEGTRSQIPFMGLTNYLNLKTMSGGVGHPNQDIPKRTVRRQK